MNWLNTLMYTLYPNRCVLCHDFCQHALALCDACQRHELKHLSQVCTRCGHLSLSHAGSCGYCLSHDNPFDGFFSPYQYQGALREFIRQLKYDGELTHAKLLGLLLAKALKATHGDTLSSLDAIVPTPLHPSRLRERGFNQAALVARFVGSKIKLPVTQDWLHRTKATPMQAGLSRAKRLRNVKNAFSAHSDVGGKQILLLDDVFTTGTTLRECASALKRQGAQTIIACTLAHGVL